MYGMRQTSSSRSSRPRATVPDRLAADHALRDALVALDGRPAAAAVGVIELAARHLWLSGVPYLWTGYAERAFVLDRVQGERLLREHPVALKGARFVERTP